MSCNYCEESKGVKMYYCEACDNCICENCIKTKKEYCNDFGNKGVVANYPCYYSNTCEIYNFQELKSNEKI